jgi:hypothetical protein
MEQIIHLDSNDDIPLIRDRLEWVQAGRIVLVLPKGYRMLRSQVNLKLLQRHARDLSVEVALVTRDRVINELARETGIPVFHSLEHGESWAGGPVKKKVAPPPPIAERRPSRPRLSQIRPNVPWRGEGWFSQAFVLFLFLSLLVFMVASALLLVPGATVRLVPKHEELGEQLVIRASPDVEEIDYERLEIPARRVQVELAGSRQIATAGQKDAPADPAVGTVIFINRTNEEVEVPAGTVVATSSGVTVRFTTDNTETVPSPIGGRVDVSVTAVDPGPKGNVRPAQINTVEGPLALQVRVMNEQPASGGSVQQTGVVTRADKERLKAMLLQQLQQEAYTLLQAELKEQEFVPPESLQMIVLDETYDKFVDEIADSLSLEMRVVARGTAIAGQEANKLALRALEGKVRSDYELVPQGLQFKPGEVTGVDEAVVSFVMGVSGHMVARIDGGGVAEEIRGLEVVEAERYLAQNLPLGSLPRVEVSPDWLGRLPYFSFRIRVIVESGPG